MKELLVKVCGLTDIDNYNRIIDLSPDMVGINFYPPSSRFIGKRVLPRKENVLRVGVFVNAEIEDLELACQKHQLDYAQLHGDEDVSYCREVQEFVKVIKVFRVDSTFEWSSIEDFEFCDYFLFDTKTSKYGGSGIKFSWDDLNNYKGNTAFLVGGGVSPDDISSIKNIQHPSLAGVDINSRFEDAPGIKNPETVGRFIKELSK